MYIYVYFFKYFDRKKYLKSYSLLNNEKFNKPLSYKLENTLVY